MVLAVTPASALPYYELEGPSGAYSGRSPKGSVLIVHGGAWFGDDPSRVRDDPYVQAAADRMNDRGWRTYAIDYRSVTPGFDDVIAFYDLAKQAMGERPVCAWGTSAGAHYTALLDTRRPLSCMMLEGLPADLPALPPAVRAGVAWAFGGEGSLYWPWSPLSFPGSTYEAHAVVGTVRNDIYVPLSSQAAPWRNKVNLAHPGLVRFRWLDRGGTCRFTHASAEASCTDRRAYYDMEQAVLDAALRSAERA